MWSVFVEWTMISISRHHLTVSCFKVLKIPVLYLEFVISPCLTFSPFRFRARGLSDLLAPHDPRRGLLGGDQGGAAAVRDPHDLPGREDGCVACLLLGCGFVFVALVFVRTDEQRKK